MASQSPTPQGRLLESPTDVHSQISQKLTEDGLNPDSSELEKLLFLWKLFQHMENDLQRARESESKLKEAQAEEMKEVESYVEHIRHLSDEREALIQELETENESLKSQVVSLEQGNNEAAQAEITEMLTQQGLAEISDATQSEQIAYLLVERARLLDELEEQNNTNSGSNNNSPVVDGRTSETELKQILEQERGDFEEELSQHRESAKMMREQLKQEHEEEINALMEENGKLEEDLQKAEMQISQLKAELSKFENGEEDGSLSGTLTKPSKEAEEERNQLNREREELEREMGEVEKEREALDKERNEVKQERDRLAQDMEALQKERSSVNQEKSKMEKIRRELEGEKEEQQQKEETLEREKKQLEKEKTNLENKQADFDLEKEEFTKEKEEWERENKESPRAQTLRHGSPSRSSNDIALRKIIEEKTKIEGSLVSMKTELRTLQKERDAHGDVVSKLKGDLEKSHVQQQQLQVKNRTLKQELQELEMQLDDTETSMDSITKEKQSLSEKYDSLNLEIKMLRADAMKSSTLQDIVDILNNDKKQLSESLESLRKELVQTTSDKETLADQNQKLSKDEQELTNTLKACKEDLEKVEKERDTLLSEKHELLSIKEKQNEVEILLRKELEEMSKVKEKFVNQSETLSKENKDLLNKLDQTREDLDASKVQIQELAKQQLVMDHLKEQIQVLNTQVNSNSDELDKSKDRETMLITTQQSLQKSHDDTEKRLTHEIDDLKLKLELSLQELAKTKKQLDDVNTEKLSLSASLSRSEKLLDENSDVKDTLEEETRQKNALRLELSRVELQLSEKTVVADKFEAERKQRLELESQVSSLRDVEESLKVLSRELEKEQKNRQSLESHCEELEQLLSSRVKREELESAQEVVVANREAREEAEDKARELERSLREAQISSQSASEQLANERELRQSLESNVKELQAAVTQQSSLEELSKLREELSKERAAIKDLEESKEDVQLLCSQLEKERGLRAELTKKVAQLEAASGEQSASDVQALLEELDRERNAREEVELRAQELEQLLEDQKIDSENLHHNMSSKMMSLEKRVTALQDDLFTAQDELQAFQERYDEVVHEAELAKTEILRFQSQSQTAASKLSDTDHMTTSIQSQGYGSQTEQDLETSLVSTTAKLHETLNELNIVKSKLCHAQEELQTSGLDATHSRTEVDLLKQSLELSTKQLEQGEEDLKNARQELAHLQGLLTHSQQQLEEKQAKLDSVVQDRDEIQRELDAMCDEQLLKVTPRPIDPALYGEEERQEHVDRIATLEKLSRQLELDNREMARKLSDTMSRCEALEEQNQREKLRNTDKYQQSSRYTDQLEHDLDGANKHIRQLREELQQQQTKVFKLEADSLGISAKYESTIARLEQDNKDLKHRHRQELDTVSERMEVASTEARELRGLKREMEKELSQSKLEVSRLKSGSERLETQLQTESKLRLDLENRNSVIDNEMSKVWSQVRSLMEKNAELESTTRSQDQELNMKRSAIRQVETTLSQKEASFEASTKAITARAETAEKKVKELQRELEEVTKKMLAVESQLSASESGKVQLEDTKDKLVTIRNKLEGEKLQRTLLDQTVAELKHQVALLKQREAKVSTENKELQHTILDLEARLTQLQENSDRGYNSHHYMNDSGKRSLMDQIARLQREVKDLQFELFSVSERRDVDVKRYEERKLRTKAKLMKAREFYTLERSKYVDHMKDLDEDLRLTRAALNKEVEWRSKMDDSYKQVLREKRDLITQLSEKEETLRDKERAVSMATVRAKYLEEENGRLENRLQSTVQQKHSLDKLVKELSKREKNRTLSPVDQTAGTSGLGNSLDSGWDHDHNDNSLSWSCHPEPPANFKHRSNSVSGDDGDGDGDGRDKMVIMDYSTNKQRRGLGVNGAGLKATGSFTMYRSCGNLSRKTNLFDDEFEA